MAAEFRDNLGDLGLRIIAHWRLIVGPSAPRRSSALLFAWSGLYSVAATTGHYPFFRVFLALRAAPVGGDAHPRHRGAEPAGRPGR